MSTPRILTETAVGLSADRRLELAADGCVSVAEAEKFLGIATTEMYRLMGDGRLPFVKLGRRRLIPRRALVELLASRMQDGTD